MNLLQMSFYGTVMILVVVIIRALAINKLPKRVFLLLWGIVLVRLLVPYSLPSALSIYSLPRRFATMAEEPTIDLSSAQWSPHAPATGNAAVSAIPAAVTAAAPVDLRTVIWLIGALACALFFTMAYLKCYREFKTSLPVDNDYTRRWLCDHPIRRTIEIRQSDRISAPLTYGLFHPVILMPKTADWGDADSLKYVLAHEYVHICRFDSLIKLVLTAALCVHWFNPAVWMMYVLINRDIELSCDEAVIRRFGERTKSAYAMTLIRMEEARSGLIPLCNSFSKNAIEERIIAIMKIRKTSLLTWLTTAALVVAIFFTFATSAKAAEAKGPRDKATTNINQTAEQDNTMTSYTNPNDGKTYYSWDGGKTWTQMSDEEFEAHLSQSSVEWWTYDEYKEWLENEKVQLQDMIGEWGWTSGRGEFIWTQEIVDESIAMYEGILENIKNGMLYSKTMVGGGELYGKLYAESFAMSYNPSDIAVYEGDTTEADFSIYAPYGLVWDESKKALFWNSQRVRYFLDGVDMDGTGAMAILLEYADAAFEGEIDVHTLRQRVQNPDGSFNPMGPLTGLEKYSQAEYDMNTLCVTAALEAEAITALEIARGIAEIEELLKAYSRFGLSYEISPTTGEISMSWQEKPVHSVYDAQKGIWIANSMRGLYLGPDAVDLEAVYERGKLTGLREIDNTISEATTFVMEGSYTGETGISFAERFEKYADFGITYVEAAGASRAGNVYLNGQLVSHFADITPDGSAFSFTSAKQGGLIMRTIYDSNGRLAGLETAAA